MRSTIFDIGNVLVRYDHRRTLNSLAAFYETEVAKLLDVYADIGRAFGVGELTPDQVCTLLNSRIGANRTLQQFSGAFCAGLTRNDDALSYAASLQVEGELAVGAISNTNAIHVAWLDANVPELNEFELVIMSNEVGLLKPDLEIFELAMELLDAPAEQILYVDDIAENVMAARRLGMTGVIHTDWVQTRPQIEAWRAGHSLASA